MACSCDALVVKSLSRNRGQRLDPDRSGPDFGLLRRHGAERAKTGVRVAELLDVEQILLAGEQRPHAERIIGLGLLPAEAAEQLVDDFIRDVTAPIRVRKLEETI